MIFNEIRANKPEIGVRRRKGADDIRTATDFSVESFQMVGRGCPAERQSFNPAV